MKKTTCLILALLIFTIPILAQASPCEDETYLELKKKKIDEMSEREYQYFTTKEAACEQWKLNQQDLSKTVVIQKAETIRTVVRLVVIGCVIGSVVLFGGIFWI